MSASDTGTCPFDQGRKLGQRAGRSALAWLVVAIIGGGAWWYVGSDTGDAPSADMTTIQDPAAYAVDLIGKSRSTKAEQRDGGRLVVSYSLDTASGSDARDSFLFQAKELFSGAFNRFPDLREIELTSLATLVSVRGQESIREVATLRFTKDNAASINWKNVRYGDLPKIADRSWFHPALEKPSKAAR